MARDANVELDDAPAARRRSRLRWRAACITAFVLLCCLVVSFTGDLAHVDLTVFSVAFAMALVGGTVLTFRAPTRPVGLGMLIAVAVAFLAFVLTSFLWLGWLANELRDS